MPQVLTLFVVAANIDIHSSTCQGILLTDISDHFPVFDIGANTLLHLITVDK